MMHFEEKLPFTKYMSQLTLSSPLTVYTINTMIDVESYAVQVVVLVMTGVIVGVVLFIVIFCVSRCADCVNCAQLSLLKLLPRV